MELDQNRIAEFCRRHHIQRLSLYGSVLTDQFGPDSDVDVLVELEPGEEPDLFTFAGMEDELTVMLGRRVDLRMPEDLSEYFREQAKAEVQYEHQSEPQEEILG